MDSLSRLADFNDLDWAPLLELAFREDRVASDVTTLLCEEFLDGRIDPSLDVGFSLLSREEGVFCGEHLLDHLSAVHGWSFEARLVDGDHIRAGTSIAEGRAPWAALLSQERSVLNLLQMLSGVATETSRYSRAIEEAWSTWSDSEKELFEKPRLYHTRKTLAGLRPFQVYAACVGGASRHRLHLADRVMLKDNHKQILESQGLGFVELVAWARTRPEFASELWLVEVDSADEAMRLAAVGVRHLLLDNFSPSLVRELMPALRKVQSIEVSGGLRLDTIANYVIPGVQRLSVGALTHSARSLDISMEFQ
jgi:nicotinate-nucleotide pyrophosphorylase (carboxylating)